MSDYIPNQLGFDADGYMREVESAVNMALDRLSFSVQDLMKREIMANGNGSRIMRNTACEQVKEISREFDNGIVELVVGIDESSLGDFSRDVFVRTMVVLHGNVTDGPLMTKPGRMTWRKHVTDYHLSPTENEDGTPRKPYIMPDAMMQYEMVNGFGDQRHMLDNVLEKQINHVIDDFYNIVCQYIYNIDSSQYITGG